MIYYESNYLCHYGVKGMKWGVRHEPERNAVDRKRKQQTKKKAHKKLTTKQKIAIGAAAAAASLAILGGVYLYKDYNQSYKIDTITNYPLSECLDQFSSKNSVSLKKGTVFQRLSSEVVEDYKNAGEIYVSHRFLDNAKYKNRLGASDMWTTKNEYGKAIVHKLKAEKDIKAPSTREAAEIYLNLHPDAVQSDFKFFLKDGIRHEGDSATKSFVNELKARGYNALVDDNDEGWTKSPLILLNPSELVKSKSKHKLSYIERVISTILM